MEGRLGVVAPGAIADLMVIEGNAQRRHSTGSLHAHASHQLMLRIVPSPRKWRCWRHAANWIFAVLPQGFQTLRPPSTAMICPVM